MKSSTHKMAEAITAALGPIFHANPDYKTIVEAMALTIARVAQSTQEEGFEHRELDAIYSMASHALTIFLDEEDKIQAEQVAKEVVMDRGIDGFAAICGYVNPPFNSTDGPEFGLAAINRGMSRDARDEAEEFAGQAHGEASWENSPLHEEIARFEQEHPSGHEDGPPRAYL